MGVEIVGFGVGKGRVESEGVFGCGEEGSQVQEYGGSVRKGS